MKKVYFLLTLQPFMLKATLFAQSEELAPPSDQSFWQTLVMIGIAFLFFYVILWRPEQKRRKVIEQQRSSLKKGDRVAAMGIIGTVLRVDDQTVILKMFDGTKLEFYKAAISEVLSESEGEDKKQEDEGKK